MFSLDDVFMIWRVTKMTFCVFTNWWTVHPWWKICSINCARIYTSHHLISKANYDAGWDIMKILIGEIPLIARFMGPTSGPSLTDRTQMGPMLAPWTLLSWSASMVTSVQEAKCGFWCQKQIAKAGINNCTIFRGMQLFVHAWDTCFWHKSPLYM